MSLVSLLRFPGPEEFRGDLAPLDVPMADFPKPLYSKTQAENAGKILRGQMLWLPETEEECRQAFRIAYDWRASHAYPMRKIRLETRAAINRLRVKGALTAARLKRMSSIRKKLARQSTALSQMQDIGGSRAIVPTMDVINALLEHFRSPTKCRHKIREDRSYIDNPRQSGYRSHHLVFEFMPETAGEEPFRGRRIELQLRTRLQHAWATAVEAIDLRTYQDLKSGGGNQDWLRFFELAAAEFAEFEGTSPVPNTPKKQERIDELNALNGKLLAVDRLRNIGGGMHYSQSVSSRATYFLIQVDSANNTIKIVGYDKVGKASQAYGFEEMEHGNVSTVVVEVDSVAALKEAYPNWFLDVRLFTQNIVNALEGRPLAHTVQRLDLRKASGPDLSFLREYFPAAVRKRRS